MMGCAGSLGEMVMRVFRNAVVGIVAAVALTVVSFGAQASTIVDASNSAFFEVDTSGVGDFAINGFRYACFGACRDDASPERLASGASIKLDFGSTLGANDLGTATFTSPFGFDIFGVSSGLAPSVNVGASLTEIFATVIFVDDAFAIDTFSILFGFGEPIAGVMVTPPSAVPLPAALPLFLTVLAGMAGLRWWRRRTTA